MSIDENAMQSAYEAYRSINGYEATPDGKPDHVWFKGVREAIEAYEAAKSAEQPVGGTLNLENGSKIDLVETGERLTGQPDDQSLIDRILLRLQTALDVESQATSKAGKAAALGCNAGLQMAIAVIEAERLLAPNREVEQPGEKPKKCNPGPCDFQPGIPLMCCKNCEEFY